MDILQFLALTIMLMPVPVLLVINLLPQKAAGDSAIYIGGIAAVYQVVTAVCAFVTLGAKGLDRYEFGLLWSIADTRAARFALTPLGVVLMLCAGIVCTVSLLLASKTITRKRVSYVSLLMILMLGMNGMLVVQDLFGLYMFMEIIGIASFVLISIFKEDSGLEGAFKYLVMSSLAGVFVLTALALLFMQTGSLQFTDVSVQTLLNASDSQKILTYLSIVLLIAGFSVKAGIVPFHSWLPDAHQSADTAVSVLLSGIVIKVAGIYGLMQVSRLFGQMYPVRVALATFGLLSIFVGALLALRQNHFKRIAAYSSVSQMGYILLALSTGTHLGLVAAAAHVFSHAAFKSTLFANAAALHEQVGTLDTDKMGGLQKKMPVTNLSSVIAFCSTAGIPPFSGFWSKTLIIIALWLSGEQVAAGAALVGSLLTGAYFLRLQRRVFFGALNPDCEQVTEVKGGIKAAEILLTVLTCGVGVLFPLVLTYLSSIGLL